MVQVVCAPTNQTGVCAETLIWTASMSAHYGALMRATVTLDKAVERMLRNTLRRTQGSFRETLNRAIRAGLTEQPVWKRKPFVLAARPMGLREDNDPTALNKLADELEVDVVREDAVARRAR